MSFSFLLLLAVLRVLRGEVAPAVVLRVRGVGLATALGCLAGIGGTGRHVISSVEHVEGGDLPRGSVETNKDSSGVVAGTGTAVASARAGGPVVAGWAPCAIACCCW